MQGMNQADENPRNSIRIVSQHTSPRLLENMVGVSDSRLEEFNEHEELNQ